MPTCRIYFEIKKLCNPFIRSKLRKVTKIVDNADIISRPFFQINSDIIK